jgi:hypothetical protein
VGLCNSIVVCTCELCLSRNGSLECIAGCKNCLAGWLTVGLSGLSVSVGMHITHLAVLKEGVVAVAGGVATAEAETVAVGSVGGSAAPM